VLRAGKTRQELCVESIEAVSPTLVETLYACKLQAGLSRVKGANRFVLGNPKAWLGTAYHEVLATAGGYSGDDLETVLSAAWDAAINREHQRAKNHPLDKRFGEPETWPSYHLVAAMARIRAQELVEARQDSPERRPMPEPTTLANHREHKFSGAGGRIVGRPDVVRHYEIIDFKSGNIYDSSAHEQIKRSYVRQLKLYAFLVNESLGWWPRRAILAPMVGLPVEIDIDPRACEKEARDAVRLLNDYNALVSRHADISQFANPSPEACQWCPFQSICPCFWDAVEPSWLDLGSAAIRGIICEAPKSLYHENTVFLAIEVQGGTERQKVVEISSLNTAIQLDGNSLKRGDEVRITGLSRRSDGTVYVTLRTVLARVQDLPSIEVVSEKSGE